MVFQAYELCGFLQKCFVRKFWHYLPILSFLILPELASASMTCTIENYYIERCMYVARYIWYVRVLTFSACTLGMVAKIIDPAHRHHAFLAQSTGKLSTIVG